MQVKTEFVSGAIVGAGILGFGMLLGGAQAGKRPAAEVIQASRLEIVDERGEVLLAVGSNKEGGVISMRDRAGKTVLLVGAAEHGGTMVINSAASGKPAFIANASAEGGTGGSAKLFNAQGLAVAEFSVTKTGSALNLTSDSNSRAISIQASREEAGVITALSRTGKPSLRLFSNVAGSGVIETYCQAGTPLVSLSSTEGGHGQMSTYSGDLAKPLISLTATAQHEGHLYTYNAAGQPMIALASRPGEDSVAEDAAQQPGVPTMRIFNKFGEPCVMMESDAKGNGKVTALTRSGEGRSLAP